MHFKKWFSQQSLNEGVSVLIDMPTRPQRPIENIQDLCYQLYEKFYKEYNYDRNLKRHFLEIADHIICISNNTKKDLQYFYDIEDSKISVIHLGIDRPQFSYLKKKFG